MQASRNRSFSLRSSQRPHTANTPTPAKTAGMFPVCLVAKGYQPGLKIVLFCKSDRSDFVGRAVRFWPVKGTIRGFWGNGSVCDLVAR